MATRTFRQIPSAAGPKSGVRLAAAQLTRRRVPLSARSTAMFVREAVSTLNKRVNNSDEVRTWLDSGMYPDYYLNSFHYQTDGWLSARSAQVYEFSTETLFFGRQDSMQRTNLLPIHDFMQRKVRRSGGEGRRGLSPHTHLRM